MAVFNASQLKVVTGPVLFTAACECTEKYIHALFRYWSTKDKRDGQSQASAVVPEAINSVAGAV